MTKKIIKSPHQKNYINHYLKISSIYPSVFSLKMFLGRNPDLNFSSDNTDFSGKSVLDIGFGDGRDLYLFCELGFDVFGIEVSEEVVAHTKKKFKKLGFKVNLSKGYNEHTGFNKNKFDYVYSAAALMYLKNEKSNIKKTLKHIYGILKSGGYFLGTFTRFDSHIQKNSKKIDKNRIIVKDEFYKVREGQLYWLHNTKKEVEKDLLEAGFLNCKVYNYDVNWFGTRETMYLFYAKK